MCNAEDCLHYDYIRLAWDIGFVFEDYEMKSGFDFNVIGLVDVEKVAKDRDIPTVVKHIPTLLNFRLDNEIGKVLEPNFVKIFRLSQLAIQYLIFCKKYLDSTVALIKNELVVVNDEKSELETYLNELKVENVAIARKYEELKATLSTSIFKCEECSKTFYSEEYLMAHIRRRHQVHNVQMQTEADKLQLEIKELKQRLNNTERLINVDETLNGKVDREGVIISKETVREGVGEKEKEFEPNNDAVLEKSIQFKFEQLKNHIETEINNLKDEDFYKAICEKYFKERVAKNSSVSSIGSATEAEKSKDVLIQSGDNSQEMKSKTRDVSVEVDVIDIVNTVDNEVDMSSKHVKGVEICTQTDWKAVSEGTSMSPQPTPRKLTKPHDDGDHHSIGAVVSNEQITTSTPPTPLKALVLTRKASFEAPSPTNENNRSEGIVLKTIEEKLAKEVELQRETLEHILDLKLSGSLNKMEAQMSAFWQKLNAWESNLTFTKSNSVPSVNVHSEPVMRNAKENGDVVLKRQNSIGSFTSNSPIHNKAPTNHVHQVQPRQVIHNHREPVQSVPKVLPRSLNSQKQHTSPVIVVPKPRSVSKMVTNDVRRFLDSSDEETGTESKTEESKSDSQSTSGESPSNIKPTNSFKKRLEDALQQRLKPPTTVQTVATVHAAQADSSTSALRKASDKGLQSNGPKNGSKPMTRKTECKHFANSEEAGDTNDDGEAMSDYADMKNRLKRHVEESVNQRLKDIGVSPHWKGLPEKSYVKAMEIVEHHATLAKKNVTNFYKIRKNIERVIDKEIEMEQDGRKRRATVHLPVCLKSDRRRSIDSSIQPESAAPSDASVDIPLQRVAGRPSIKSNSRRGSLQTDSTNSSPLKSMYPNPSNHPLPSSHQQPQMVQTIESLPILSPPTDRKHEIDAAKSSETVTMVDKTSGATTIAIAENVPSLVKTLVAAGPQNQKKKVLFHLDSDTEPSEHPSLPKQISTSQMQNKKDLVSFVKQEKSKLDKEKQGKKNSKSGHLELHTGSESSDWDISDIT